MNGQILEHNHGMYMEQDDYWNLSNSNDNWYISKTGYQISSGSDYNNVYANVEWNIVLDGD